MNDVNKKLLLLVNLYRKHGGWSSQLISENDDPIMDAHKITQDLLDLGVELDVPEQPKYRNTKETIGRKVTKLLIRFMLKIK